MKLLHAAILDYGAETASVFRLFGFPALPLFTLLQAPAFAPLASAQSAPPTFGLQAPSSCTGADPGYTCTGTAQVISYVTPAGTGTQGQFGCVVLNFTLGSGTTQPFGSSWATVTDTDSSGPNGTSETNGPNGCTYEARSNNGVVIVRNLMNSSSPSIETYSIVNSGLLP